MLTAPLETRESKTELRTVNVADIFCVVEDT